ncbi:MAG: hypothetical protein WDN67_02130 [Candidatus Moraniibacteriota bacterium]
MGKFSDVPRVVVGMEHRVIEKLAKQWMSQYEEDEQQLFTTPVQRMILEQALVQLQAQSEYAFSLGHEEIADTLLKESQLVRSIIDSKNISLGEMENDRVHRQIIDSAKSMQDHGQIASNYGSSEKSHSPNGDEAKASNAGDKNPSRPTLSLKK